MLKFESKKKVPYISEYEMNVFFCNSFSFGKVKQNSTLWKESYNTSQSKCKINMSFELWHSSTFVTPNWKYVDFWLTISIVWRSTFSSLLRQPV